ncbi:unnamed protein product [Danaus chrysippus]|uniref:(African queen) hypothetical protein n=1 Tax=Danaus chrysippus TaxID=151541 RepID=A0A8J2QN43_9NEOP|nr:unnamed protein product [Danaus chrysippus]
MEHVPEDGNLGHNDPDFPIHLVKAVNKKQAPPCWLGPRRTRTPIVNRQTHSITVGDARGGLLDPPSAGEVPSKEKEPRTKRREIETKKKLQEEEYESQEEELASPNTYIELKRKVTADREGQKLRAACPTPPEGIEELQPRSG